MNIIKLEFKNSYKNLLTWIVSLGLIIIIFLLFFPSMKTEAMKALTDAKLEGISPLLLESIGLTKMVDFSNITNYFGYVLQFVVIAIYIFITQNAYNALIKEEKEGTIEFIYSKPVKRSELFLSKFIYLFISYTILIISLAITSLCFYYSLSDYAFVKSLKDITILFSGIYFVGFIYISTGLLLSVLSKSKTEFGALGAILVMVTYLIGVLSSILKKVAFLKYLSPIKWVEYQNILNKGIKTEIIFISIVVIILFVYVSLQKYQKRDFLV